MLETLQQFPWNLLSMIDRISYFLNFIYFYIIPQFSPFQSFLAPIHPSLLLFMLILKMLLYQKPVGTHSPSIKTFSRKSYWLPLLCASPDALQRLSQYISWYVMVWIESTTQKAHLLKAWIQSLRGDWMMRALT